MTIRYHSAEGVMLGQTDFSPSAVRTDFACDMLGSVVEVLDENGDAILERRFKPYSGLLSGTNAPWSFGWTGNTGSRNNPLLYAEQYNRARHYSTTTKQWTTVDPLWPHFHPYAYVGAEQLARLDLHGLSPNSSSNSAADALKGCPTKGETGRIELNATFCNFNFQGWARSFFKTGRQCGGPLTSAFGAESGRRISNCGFVRAELCLQLAGEKCN